MQNKKVAKWMRIARYFHRKIALVLFVFFFILSITGTLLGIKKHTGGTILPKTETGISNNPSDWLSTDSLLSIANRIVEDSISTEMDKSLQRIDYRPHKGIAKFIYNEGFWGIQLDCTTGEVLAINKRKSDIIENFHDGSILDYWFDTSKEQVKLIYTVIMGVSMLWMTSTGLWMLIGPKIIRRNRKG
ncbi:MAG: hypothetical protein ACPG4Z_08490 [Chitinophagales bacterium]